MLELTDRDREKNQILAALTEEEHASWSPHVTRVRLHARQVLVQPEQGEGYVYFPTEAIASIMVVMNDGAGVEVMLIGSEGCVELEAAIGVRSPATQTTIHIAGNAWRVPAAIIRRALFIDTRFSRILRNYMQQRFMQVAQLAACNRLHAAEQRLARWLLTMQERINSNTFPITHEILGQVLGTKRSTISQIAKTLERSRIISYTHGIVHIRDRKLLESMTCECYFRMREFSG